MVDTTSADPGVAHKVIRCLDADHSSIAKPNDRQHPVYIAVNAQLRRIADAQQSVGDDAARDGLYRHWPLPHLGSADPYGLGVFPGLAGPDAPYVARDVDDELASAIQRGGVVVLKGPSKSGKSRTAFEVARRALVPQTRVVVPRSGDEARAALSPDALDALGARDDAPLLVWLDDLEDFIGLQRLDLRAIADATAMTGVVVLGTIRSREHDRMIAAEGELGRAAKEVLRAAETVRLDVILSQAERADAERLYPDERFGEFEGIGEHFAAARQLREKLEAGLETSPVGVAIVRAAADWRRTGMPRPPSQDELRALAGRYLRELRPLEPLSPESFADGLAWATDPVERVVTLLGRPDEPLAMLDYVTDLREREAPEVPAETWSHVIAVADTGDLVGVGISAYLRGLVDTALTVFSRVAASGHGEAAPRAMFALGVLHEAEGRLDEAVLAWEQAITSGHPGAAPIAMFTLGVLHREKGRRGEAVLAWEQAITSGHAEAAPRAMLTLGILHEVEGRLDEAVVAYEWAIASGHPQVSALASYALAQLQGGQESGQAG